MKLVAISWDFAASPSPYWVSRISNAVPSKAARKPVSRFWVETVEVLMLTMPTLPSVMPASVRAASRVSPASLPAAVLSVARVCSAGVLAGEST